MIEKGVQLRMDMVILDLEDAVPIDQKEKVITNQRIQGCINSLTLKFLMIFTT